MTESVTGRVMVIALDGATWRLARPWMEAGHMPNLARLVAQGVSAEMQAELPPSSVPNWPAFMTGKNAGKHGCAWWLARDSSGRLDRVPIDSRSISGQTLWSYLSAHGKTVIVQNVPVTYPVEAVQGALVSGLLTPRLAQDFVFPPELKPELDAAVGGYRVYPKGSYGRGREAEFLEALIENIRHHTQASEFLLDSQDWSFFILVLGPTDEGAHRYWHFMDASHRLHQPAQVRQFGDALRSIYTAADEALGVLARHLHERDTLIVMSDHGFGPLERFFLPNNWMLRNGYLHLRRSPVTLARRMFFRLGFTPRNVYPIGKQLLSLLRGWENTRQRLDPVRQGGRSPLRHLFLSDADIDWSATRAIATGFLCSQIYINLRGREPQGLVEPAEYEALREQLQRQLSDLADPSTGKPHYARVWKREELFSGPMLNTLPDLLCEPADLRTADAGMDFRSNRLFETDAALTGTHRIEGIFVMRGPGVRRGVEIPSVRIFDLAPTIVHLLGLAVPGDMDGTVIPDAIVDGRPPMRAGTTFPRPSAGRQSVMTEEDEELVKARLRELGYLG